MKKESLRLTFEKGVTEAEENSVLPAGYLAECSNWVPEPTGGLRARIGWLKGSTSGAPATRKAKGQGLFTRITDPTIVQQSAVYLQEVASGAGQTQLTMSPAWGVPTTVGNTLILVCTVGFQSAGGLTSCSITATNWTSAASSQDLTGTATGMSQIFYIPNAASQSGAQSFTVTPNTNILGSIRAAFWLVEVSGISPTSPLDRTATQATPASSSVTATTSATNQASEFIIAVDSAAKVTTGITLSTASSGWTERSESSAVIGSPNVLAHGAAWYTTARRTTGTPSIQVDSTATADHTLTMATFKGWNAAASPAAGVDLIVAANDNGTSFDVYSIDYTNVGSAAWTLVDAGLGNSSDGLPVQFATGLGAIWYSHTSFSGIRRWDGLNTSTVSGSPVGARALAIHQNRLWAGGAQDLPHRVRYSQALDGLTWTGTGTGFFDINALDGQAIECMVPHITLTMFGTLRSSLIIGKRSTLWALSGDDVGSMVQFKMNAGDAAPGVSMAITADGVIIAGPHQAWFYDGTSVARLSNDLQKTYGQTGNYMSVSYVDNVGYICDEGTGKVFAYEFDSKVWRVEDVSALVSQLFVFSQRQFFGPKNSTVASLTNYRDFPNGARAKDSDAMTQTFHIRTPDWMLGAPNRSFVMRHLTFKLRQRGGTATGTPITFTPYYDGVASTATELLDPKTGMTVFEERFDLGTDARSFGFALDQTLPAGDATVFDVEDIVAEYTLSEVR